MTSAKKRERGQGSIGNVPGSRFLYIWYYDNAGKQHRESTKSTLRSVAQEMLNQRLAAMGRGERGPNEVKNIRYEDMRSILLEEYKRQRISIDKLELDSGGKPTGLRRTGLKFLDDFFKAMRLDQMDIDVLQAYKDSRVEPMCTKDEKLVIEDETPKDRAMRLKKSRDQHERTVNRDLALLRRMIVLTVRQKKLQFTLPYFPMTSELGNTRQGFLEPAKFVQLRNAMPKCLHPYVTFLYTTGSRTGAAVEILWDWVNLKEQIIEIPEGVTKNGEALTLPIDPELLSMLKRMFRKEGTVFDTTNFRKAFNAAAVAVGLGTMYGTEDWQYEGITPHDLRRSFARNSTRSGNTETVAMKIGGWKTGSVFRRYNITSVDDIKLAAKRTADYNASSMQVGRKRSKQK
jgi:integrase